MEFLLPTTPPLTIPSKGRVRDGGFLTVKEGFCSVQV